MNTALLYLFFFAAATDVSSTPIFSPPQAPLIGSPQTTNYKIKTATMGDGYVIRAQDGINSLTDTIDLTWPALTPNNCNVIKQFFDDTRGYKAFRWTAPGDTTEKLWTCGSPKIGRFGIYSTLDITLTQVHDVL